MTYATNLKCVNCGNLEPLGLFFEGCSKCRSEKFASNLTVTYDYQSIGDTLTKENLRNRTPSVRKYSELLPLDHEQWAISLQEGGTPLIKCSHLGKELGIRELYVKDETRNPTWSFKDRYCVVAVGMATKFKAPVVTASSSGNHGSSATAYAARAGIGCVLFTMEYAPKSFLTLMQVYGAKVIPVTTVEGRWKLMQRAVHELQWYPINSYTMPMPTGNPYGPEGYKTIAYEVIEQLDWQMPDTFLFPLAGGDGIASVWKGCCEMRDFGFLDGSPKMIAAETEAAGPIKNALAKNLNYVERVSLNKTIAFSIGSSISSFQGLKAIKDSGGTSVTVSDQEILRMQLKLASSEGIYAEASSVTSLAALKKLVENSSIDRDGTIVCILTSSGLKDPDVTRAVLSEPKAIDAEWEQLTAALDL